MYNPYNENAQQFSNFISDDEDPGYSTGCYGSYLIAMLYKLKKTLRENPHLEDSVVAVTCFINPDIYSNAENFVKSSNGRRTGVLIKTELLSKSISLPKQYNDDMNRIVIFNGEPSMINLRALLGLIDCLMPVYEREFKSKVLDSKVSAMRSSVYGQDDTYLNSMSSIIENKYNCTCKIPQIDSIEFCKNESDKNPLKISWFEPYNNADKKYHDDSAIEAINEYKTFLMREETESMYSKDLGIEKPVRKRQAKARY